MKAYAEKMEYLTLRQKWLCPIAASKGVKGYGLTQLHHRLHDHKNYRAKYPLFIDSIMNIVAVNHSWHIANPSALHLGEYYAGRCERFLERHPRFAMWVNCPSGRLFK